MLKILIYKFEEAQISDYLVNKQRIFLRIRYLLILTIQIQASCVMI
jgi:hypothetical protein